MSLFVLIGCLSVPLAGLGTSPPAAAVSPDFSITTSPALVPSFSPTILDYAVRCTGSPTTQVTTAGTGPVTVGATTSAGPVNVNLPLVAGQGLQITNGGTTYYIRCLPSDFPTYSSTVTGTPQASNGYFLTIGGYAIIFNTQGVPVWWYKGTSDDAKFLSPSEVAWVNGANKDVEVRNLSGSLLQTVGGGSNPLDPHDFQLLPNGDYLAIMDVVRNCPAVPSQCVDLSSWGLSSQSTITDNVIVELNPSNQIVWQWSVADHIDVATANVNWRDWFPDVIHMNSIEYDGNGGIIFSARHFDAIYRIDMATGDVTWKLGGSADPAESHRERGSVSRRGRAALLWPTLRPAPARRVSDRPRQRQQGQSSPPCSPLHHRPVDQHGHRGRTGHRCPGDHVAVHRKRREVAWWRLGRRLGRG